MRRINLLWGLVLVLAGCGDAAVEIKSLTPNTPSGGPKTYTVASGNIADLENAALAAKSGDKVNVNAGMYTITNTIMFRDGVLVDGSSGIVLVAGPGTGPLTTIGSNTTIRGFTFTGSAGIGRVAVSSTGTQGPKVEYCKVFLTGGIVFTNVTEPSVTFTIFAPDSTISGNRGAVFTDCIRPVVRRDTFIAPEVAIALTNPVNFDVEENIIFNAVRGVEMNLSTLQGTIAYNQNSSGNPYALTNGGSFTPVPGTKETSIDPGFVNYETDYRLAPGSSCRTNGKTGGPIGALPNADYQATLTVAVDPTSPTGNIAKAPNTTLYVFRFNSSGGSATLNVNHIIQVWRTPSSTQVEIGTPILYESGSPVATTTWNSNSGPGFMSFKLTRKIEIHPGTPRVFTVKGDTSQWLPGDTLQLRVANITWSDGAIQEISDGISPIGQPADGPQLTFN